ncbi:MAG: flagellar motor stator protein MotA [Pseudomonadota bacterium]|nr:flagellar motor stator protein MotA [Pseudomonadota bacterium]
MLVIIGSVVVTLCVFGGYMAMGGKLGVLWQPFEAVIIVGAAIGAFIIGSPMSVIKQFGGAMGMAFKGSPYKKDHFIELLSMQFQVFKLAKAKGMLALEPHVENAEDSDLFGQFPNFHANHHALTFMCDYLHMISLGTEKPHEMEALMDEEIDAHHAEKHRLAAAVQSMADGLPALGIVTAVLGVIKTMGSISEPPEVLGKLIGGALDGSFLGVFVAYGFVGSLAVTLNMAYESESKYYTCMKAGILAYLAGYAPAICGEFARKSLISDVRPTFYEVEEAVSALPTAE